LKSMLYFVQYMLLSRSIKGRQVIDTCIRYCTSLFVLFLLVIALFVCLRFILLVSNKIC